ncbi:hypothetical protein J2T16_002253 [Paenibacillus intestini]|nr:hypothetical protein [Paenibacillus intestini]
MIFDDRWCLFVCKLVCFEVFPSVPTCQKFGIFWTRLRKDSMAGYRLTELQEAGEANDGEKYFGLFS